MMPERQVHGFNYANKYIVENNLIKDMLYTGIWDAYDKNNVPYRIKTFKYKSGLDLSDYFRNAKTDKDFFLVVSFYEGTTSNIIEEYKLFIPAKDWREILEFNLSDKLEDWIKNKVSNSHDYDEQWKKERLYYKNAFGKRPITLRFKRDHKEQRRIQCGMTNRVFYDYFVKRYIVE